LNQREAVLFKLEKEYSRCRVVIPENWLSYDAFLRVIRKLDYTSTPGYPYSLSSPTIGDYLGFNGLVCDELKLASLWLDVTRLLEQIEVGLVDDIFWRMFIKFEPHKLSKLSTKRYRLIACAPLHLQVVWHMCFDSQNEKLLEESLSIPTQHGMTLFSGAWKHYHRGWQENKLVASTDCRAYDWTLPHWALDDAKTLRKRLVTSPANWNNVVDFLYHNAYVDCNIILSNGDTFKQIIPGCQKSGCVNTISDNGFTGDIIDTHVCIDAGIPFQPKSLVGDDKLTTLVMLDYMQEFEKYGISIKTATVTQEFMGNQWDRGYPEPMYFGKHAFRLLHAPDREILVEMLDAFLRLYAYSENRCVFRTIARELGIENKFYSDIFYRFAYDNPLSKDIMVLRHNKLLSILGSDDMSKN